MTLAWQLNRLRAMTPAEVAHRVWRLARARAERAWYPRSRVPEPRGSCGAPWVASLPVELDRDTYRSAADRVLSGRWNVFALEDADLGFPPRWNRDPRTGTDVALRFGKLIDYRDADAVGDVKYLWEINRHLELVTLAQAWHLTRDPAYLEGGKEMIASWCDACPFPWGINWTSSLEAAIRLVNWSIAWHLFGGSHGELFSRPRGERLRRSWLESVFNHCRFVAGYLSRFSSANNHLFGELTGLLIGSLTWPLWKQSARWRSIAHRALASEALVQNLPDGVNAEQAFWYHHSVADMMLLAGLYSRANGIDFGSEYWRRLEAMLEFVSSMMDVGGNVPAVGDSDDGVLARLDPVARRDVYRPLLAAGAVLYSRPGFHRKSARFDDKTRWLLGDAAAGTYASLGAAASCEPPRLDFTDGGYYVLGSELDTPREIRVVADCGPLGYLSIAAHGHADALAFTLSVRGQPLLIDAGTYAYHASDRWRAYFRGTSAHNSLRVDGVDQSVPGGRFLWLSHAQSRVSVIERSPQLDRLVAEHDGYCRLGDPVVHRREWLLEKSNAMLTVVDEIVCHSTHHVEMFWHFAPGCLVRQREGALDVQSPAGCAAVSLPRDLTIELRHGDDALPAGWVSRSLDRKEPTVTARVFGEVSRTTQFRTVFDLRGA